jgi:hypothetical protein
MENLKFKKYGLLLALLIGLATLVSSCVTHVRGYDYGYRRPYYGRPAYRYVVPLQELSLLSQTEDIRATHTAVDVADGKYYCGLGMSDFGNKVKYFFLQNK